MRYFIGCSFIILLFIQISCTDDNMDITPNSADKVNSTDTIYQGILSTDNNTTIKKISNANGFTSLTLENGKTVLISDNNLVSFKINEFCWTVELSYADASIQQVPYLGESIQISEDSITLNPYGNAPLSALLSFTTPVPGKFKITIKSKNDSILPISNIFTNYTNKHKIPIYGLYADYENTLTIEFLDFYGNSRISTDVKIQTEEISRLYAGTMTVQINNYSYEETGKLFLLENAIYDVTGEVRWYTSLSG